MARKNTTTDAIDKALGIKIKTLRISKGWSRNQLGALIDVTHQQIQKYELGSNRISAGRLMAIASAFKVSISSLFEEGVIIPKEARSRAGIELIRNFNAISDSGLQDSVMILTRNMARTSN